MAKAVLKGKFLPLNAFFRKEEKISHQFKCSLQEPRIEKNKFKTRRKEENKDKSKNQ